MAKKLVELGKRVPPEVMKSCNLDGIILKLRNFALMWNEKSKQ